MTDNERDQAVEPSAFAEQIMTDVYEYRKCGSLATFWSDPPEPDSWCLTHDQSVRYCREYQESILGPLTALIEARDGLLRTGDDTTSGHGYKGTAADGAFVGDLLAEAEKLRAERDQQDAYIEDQHERLRKCAADMEDAQADRDRAVAETANLEADYDRRGERLWRLAAKAGHIPNESDNDATAEHAIETAINSAVAEMAALRARVVSILSVCSNTDGEWLDGDAEIPVGEVLRMAAESGVDLDATIRALDGGRP